MIQKYTRHVTQAIIIEKIISLKIQYVLKILFKKTVNRNFVYLNCFKKSLKSIFGFLDFNNSKRSLKMSDTDCKANQQTEFTIYLGC